MGNARTCKTVGTASSGAAAWGPGAAAIVPELGSSTRAGMRGSGSGSLCVRATGDEARPSGVLLMPLATAAEAGMDTCKGTHQIACCPSCSTLLPRRKANPQMAGCIGVSTCLPGCILKDTNASFCMWPACCLWPSALPMQQVSRAGGMPLRLQEMRGS